MDYENTKKQLPQHIKDKYRTKTAKEVRPLRNEYNSDMAMSARHREYGLKCAVTDVDYLEYHYDRLICMVDMKYALVYPLDITSNYSINAQRMLADNSCIPFIIAYRTDSYGFIIQPVNDYAKAIFGSEDVQMTEEQYVESMYTLRGLTLPDDIRAGLNKVYPFDDTGKLIMKME